MFVRTGDVEESKKAAKWEEKPCRTISRGEMSRDEVDNSSGWAGGWFFMHKTRLKWNTSCTRRLVLTISDIIPGPKPLCW